MNDYTKGPWHCKPESNGVFGADGYAITYPIVEAITVLGSDYQSHQWITRNAEANARLIAAAPELLEACKTFHEWLVREEIGFANKWDRNTEEGEAKWREWYDENLRLCALAQEQARAAIAKAKGETK